MLLFAMLGSYKTFKLSCQSDQVFEVNLSLSFSNFQSSSQQLTSSDARLKPACKPTSAQTLHYSMLSTTI